MASVPFATVPWAMALLTVAAVAAASPALGQNRTSQPLRVALADQFPDTGARAFVLRHASPDKGDVIVLSAATATPEALMASVAVLRHLRQSAATPGRDEIATVKGFAPLRRADPRLVSRLTAVLARVRTQPSTRIGNLGPGRWIEVAEGDLSP